MKSILKQIITPTIFMLAGILFFTIGSGMTMRQRSLEKQGIQAQGVVIELQENHDSDGSTYTPVVQFSTPNGESIVFTSSYSSSPPAFDVGETVMVVYPPDNPTNAIIKGDGQFLHISLMFLGGIVALVGFYLVVSTLRAATFISPEE